MNKPTFPNGLSSFYMLLTFKSACSHWCYANTVEVIVTKSTAKSHPDQALDAFFLSL